MCNVSMSPAVTSFPPSSPMARPPAAPPAPSAVPAPAQVPTASDHFRAAETAHLQGVATPHVNLVEGPSPAATSEQIKQAVDQALAVSYRQVPHRPEVSRHTLNRQLQTFGTDGTQNPQKQVNYDGADVVIIAFEGTGAFDARRAPVMQQAAQILSDQGLRLDDGDALYREVSNGIAAKEGKNMNWSGLATGPLASLLEDPEAQAQTQWLSFPSEEFEVLAGGEILNNLDPQQLKREILGSTVGVTPGISQAVQAMKEIQAQAQAQGKNPKFVVVSHSSGGRSTVKFLEKMKGQDFPLVMTLDPVREAHEAVGEALKEVYLYKGTEHNMNRLRSAANWLLPESLELEPQKVYPPMVRSQAQPASLYKPGNVGKMVNFYQKKDEEGLKMPQVRFGIQGSPVQRAENIEIHDVGKAGHGEITYHQKVLTRFMSELKGVLKD